MLVTVTVPLKVWLTRLYASPEAVKIAVSLGIEGKIAS
jgi:hypothetical protein